MRDHPHQQWHPYTDWEDWHAGMYGTQSRDVVAEQARTLLGNPDVFGQVLAEVARRWPNATAHNLSNMYRNHQPWCGRAAACLEFGATIRETSQGWWDLSPTQQIEANQVADRFTFMWRSAHLAGQMRML